MKFIFERDMKKKGDCFRCPCVKLNTDFTSFFCELLGKPHPDDSECPLEEAKSPEWHPYPKERPKAAPFDELYSYLATVEIGGHRQVMELHYAAMFIYLDDCVVAWAEMPKPYKEGES